MSRARTTNDETSSNNGPSGPKPAWGVASPASPTTTALRSVISLVLGVVVFVWGTTVVVGNNRTTPTPSALDSWFSPTWLHVGNKVSAAHSAVGAGVLAQSLPDIHSACEEGLSTY